jgi:diguanylate cyclase (GGDEF)-like protein
LAAFIFVIGVFNLVLGCCLAFVLSDPSLRSLAGGGSWRDVCWRLLIHLVRRQPLEVELEEEEDPAEELAEVPAEERHEEAPALPPIATIQELPEAWQQALREGGLQLHTFATGIPHYLLLEGALHLERLQRAEVRAREALAEKDSLVTEQIAADLRFINVDWSRKLRQMAELIEERADRLGTSAEPVLRLARVLRDQGAQVREFGLEVHATSAHDDGAASYRRVPEKLQQPIHLSHLLRDYTENSLAAIYLLEGTLGQLDPKLRQDAATGLLSRLGLEALFAEEFPTGTRPTAAMRISLNRFGKVNQRLGGRAGDQAMKTIAQLLAELLASKCDKCLIARQAGTDFLILAHESTVDDLAAVGEHIRQSFEATSFGCQGADFSLTLTISVAAVSANATLANLLDRLEVVKSVAIKAGPNRSARWENGTAVLTQPPTIPVVSRLITIEATAA